MMTWVFFLFDGKLCFDQQYVYLYLLQRNTVDSSGYFYCTELMSNTINNYSSYYSNALNVMNSSFRIPGYYRIVLSKECLQLNNSLGSNSFFDPYHFFFISVLTFVIVNINFGSFENFLCMWDNTKEFQLKNAKDEEEYWWYLIIRINLVSLISFTTW